MVVAPVMGCDGKAALVVVVRRVAGGAGRSAINGTPVGCAAAGGGRSRAG